MQEVLAQITWYHHITILDKVKEPDARDFYIQSTISQGWSRDVLVRQIEGLYQRQRRTLLSRYSPKEPAAWLFACTV